MSLPLMLAITTLALGFLPTAWLWHARARSTRDCVLTLVTTGGLVTFAYAAGPWLFVSYYLRYIALGAYEAVAFASLWHRGKTVITVSADLRWSGLAFRTAALVTVLAADVCAWRAGIAPEGALDFRFPLAHGRSSVLEGGNSLVTNPFHRTNPRERYALGLVKLNSYGARAKGLAPQTVTGYAVYDEPVSSPCDGNVVEASDGLADNSPGRAHAMVPAGNHIVLRCQGVELLLAHLREGSVSVHPMERVVRGQQVGRVGNSGNTSEPHLHISASRGRRAVPLTFDGRFLSLNSVHDGNSKAF